MKRIKVMLGVLIFHLFFYNGYAQGYTNEIFFETIPARHIWVTFLKTTHLIFPYNVQSVDYGSNGIIVQQRKGAGNILHVKAAKEYFPPTSLSVVTTDGAFYSFVVEYAPDVDELNYVFTHESSGLIANVPYPQEKLQQHAARIEGERPVLRTHTRKDFSVLHLQGSYLFNQQLWMKLRLHNVSPVSFPNGYITFLVRDRKRVKKQAMQESAIMPVYLQLPDTVKGKRCDVIIAAFEPFVLPKRKQLIIQLGDNTSHRTVELRIKPRHLQRTKVLH